MNLIVIVGNVGRDPELRHTQTGKAVANFSVATSERNSETQWFNVTVWDKQAELANQYVRKGDRVAVHGRMRSREHDGKTYWDLIADRVEFGSKREGEAKKIHPEGGRAPERARPAKKIYPDSAENSGGQHQKLKWNDGDVPF